MYNNQFQPQTDPNVNYQPGYTYMPPPRKKRKLLWLWITLALIGAAGIAAVLMFTDLLPDKPAAAPRYALMLDGSEVMLVRGGEAVSLGEASYTSDSYSTYLNSASADNGGTLFYLCDIDEDTGEGTLMKVETAGSSPPEEVAQDVCTACVSEDGSRVLYITNMGMTGGDLMLIEKGQAKRVAKNVVPKSIEFSDSGEYFGFLQSDKVSGGYEFTVSAGRSAEDIEEADDFKTEDDLYIFHAYVLDNGTLVYAVWAPEGTYNETRMCSCEYGGKPDKLAEDGYLEWTDGSVYYYVDKDYTLYYVDREGEEDRIIRDFKYFLSVWDGSGQAMKDRLVMYQAGSSEDTYNVFALTPGQDEEKICEADKYSVAIGPALKCVSYTLDGELYLSVKGEDGWEETSMDTKSLQQTFEDSGRYFYFIAAENETDKKGDLYRCDMETGEKESLQKDVTGIRLVGNALYTICEDRGAYYFGIDGKETKIAEDALELIGGSGGVYIKRENGEAFSLLFVPQGGTAEKTAARFDQLIYSGGSIEYQMPLPEDVKQALDELREDALIFLDIYKDTSLAETSILHRTYEESRDLAGELKGRPDVPKEVQDILWDFYFGFWDIKFARDYTDMENYTDAVEYYKESEEYLSDAVSAYEAYLAK